MKNTIFIIVISLGIAALSPGCGGAQSGAEEGNYIPPIIVEPCANPPQDGMTIEQRSLVAMVAALGAARYTIHGVSADEYKIFTNFKESRGMVMGWEAQVYNDGSVSLTLPSTTPMQPAGILGRITAYGTKIGQSFNKLKCRPYTDLRSRCERLGYTF